ncbi:Copper homeostasis protein cutC -like protein [Toxocara canis]|uniref:Copper homeostasis protein cutC homolog n=1 Tax=Toxocara canis TaxID=6265 RepID=A0A0B2UTU4_TOXCA|nr:Copper homeostasis protein cutC -like protein [Toxocara canis]
MLVEICVDSLTSAKAAAQGGANRIELCSALKLGGLTPTTGILRAVKSANVAVDVFCMIRCRGGDFVYGNDEMETMFADISILKANGADGFVFGALTSEGRLDEVKCRRVVEACYPLPVTLHRAFDHSSDWREAVDSAVRLSFSCILTSGLQATVSEGIECLKQIVHYADGRIGVMAGSGVTVESLPVIKNAIPMLSAVHSSASIKKKSQCLHRPLFAMGSDDSFDSEKETSAEIVSQIVAIAHGNDPS